MYERRLFSYFFFIYNIKKNFLVNAKSHNLLPLKFEHLKQKYINASNFYYSKLKDLNLFYSFPDQIFDDIQCLINGLSLEKQVF